MDQVGFDDLSGWYSSSRVYEVSFFRFLVSLARLSLNDMKNVKF